MSAPTFPTVIRDAAASEATQIRCAIELLQEHERGLHDIRLQGETIAEPYLRSIMVRTAVNGTILVAEINRSFVPARSPTANRFSYIFLNDLRLNVANVLHTFSADEIYRDCV